MQFRKMRRILIIQYAQQDQELKNTEKKSQKKNNFGEYLKKDKNMFKSPARMMARDFQYFAKMRKLHGVQKPFKKRLDKWLDEPNIDNYAI